MAVTAQGGDTEAMNGGARALALLDRGRMIVAAMPAPKRWRIAAMLLLIGSGVAAVFWWGSQTQWRTVYSGLEPHDLQQVESDLGSAGVRYQIANDGAIQVPAELLDKARMAVAAKGMPQTGRMGFELFDKPNWVGSEFDEKVNYQRALEGEIEHTIGSMTAVSHARVHLVLAKPALFDQQREAAKASVVLKLKRGMLMHEEIESVRNLVAGAVEGLAPEQVTLVDADGRADLSMHSGSAMEAEAEQRMAQRLVTMLEPLAGRDNVRATVNLVRDDSVVEWTDEVVDPQQVVTLSTEKKEQQSGVTRPTSGVPGTVSNTAQAATAGSAVADAQAAKEALPVYPNANAGAQTLHEESSSYAVTKHTTHAEHGPGRIVKVSAAVLINDRPTLEGNGKTFHMGWKPRTPDEMQRLQQLASAAVGFDEKRGDQLVLQNISFSGNVAEPPAEGAAHWWEEARAFMHQQPDLVRLSGAVMIGVLLLVMVLRPVAKQTAVLLRAPELISSESTADGGRVRRSGLQERPGSELHPEGAVGLPQAMHGRTQQTLAAIDDEGVREYLVAHIRKSPVDSTRLLTSWIEQKGEA